jgi:hypothetical protein
LGVKLKFKLFLVTLFFAAFFPIAAVYGEEYEFVGAPEEGQAFDSNKIKSETILEAGSFALRAEDFLTEPADAKLFAEFIDTSEPDEYRIPIRIDGRVYVARLIITDTTPPIAVPVPKTILQNETANPSDFVADVYDATEVTVEFASLPDFSVEGEFPVSVVLTDTSGNRTVVSSLLIIETEKKNTDITPPKIFGARNLYVANGETPDWFSGVYAEDDGGEADLKVIPPDLDTTVWGTREITYAATDGAGNETTVTRYLNIGGPKSSGSLDSQISNILSGIINDSMSKLEKARRIYDWTRSNISYGGVTDKSSITGGAAQALRSRRGDCFAYYAVSTLLMNYARIDNIGCKRLGGSATHFWSMVNAGDGWYFFDATPHADGANSFMMTNSRRQSLSSARGGNYYRFDESTYPTAVQ